ncbi:MAG: BMP family ABC transporter substrate-binding protein [Ruminococcus sp.]|nr:BMP family ABC transporter substrate-binding protein [Ruminococcus sp.]MBQ1813463.1 BMP family ABC transporter substrate-binding protein [Ruminococcus sp.]
MQQEIYYKEALKLGQKEVRSRTAKEKNPYLPVLDEIVPPEKALTGIHLGVVQIPVWFIVGTKTGGRVSAFAANFMPVLDEGTEFADKWEALYRSHISEGIRDPIKVFEYLNRYYVQEGNKRVSVLKFCGAYSVTAEVIRVLPERTNDEKIQLYYEFLEFNRYSKINFIEFTKRGSYQKLMRMMGKSYGEWWTIEEQRRFSSAYYFFEKAYKENGGDKLKITIGDAMLNYIKIYGYPELQNAGDAEIRMNLKKMWEDIALIEENETIELKTTPPEEKELKPSVLSMILPIAKPSKLKAAFVYDVPPDKSGWVSDHERGRQYAQTVLGDQAATSVYIVEDEHKQYELLEKAVADGNKILFTTSPRMLQASLRAAINYPDIVVMNCSLNISHRYLRTYYTRMYEVKFILGVLAGSLTQSGRLGYVCDYPIYGQIAGINAFALGAQMANPRTKVYLEWSSVKGAGEAALALSRRHIHLISSQDTARFTEDTRQSFGLSHISHDKTDLLAVPVWKWGVYYEKMMRGVLDKTIKSEYVNTARALNYYWGMSAGVVDIEYAPALPPSSRRYADFFRSSLISGAGKPFLTPFVTQNGDVIGSRQHELSLEQIIRMDYLAENVIGSIPSYDELNPVGKKTVDMVGVSAAKPRTDKHEET